MIKNLIDDLIYDRLPLSQALLRSRIFAMKYENEPFISWLDKELHGYAEDNLEEYHTSGQLTDKNLPNYRRVKCDLMITTTNIFGFNSHTDSYFFQDNDEYRGLDDTVYHHSVIEGIEVLETIYGQPDKYVLYNLGSENLEELMFMIMKSKFRVRRVKAAYQQFDKYFLKNIIDLTKQKLVNTLTEIYNKFPNLNDDFIMPNKKDETHNIVTNNIYGNNSPFNIAVGQTITQSDFLCLTTLQLKELSNLGVKQEQIKELEQIVKENKKDKTTLTSKIMKWLGSVSASMAARGLYDNIPMLADFVSSSILK